MAFPAVTYTFANSTTADATQVNQNFTDVLNGLSDGTKDNNINASTVNGALTVKGNTSIGNSSINTLTLNSSIASSIPVSANASWDFGSSTFGMKSLYLGANSTFTTRILCATLAASWTLTLPTSAGTAGYILSTDGSGNSSWIPPLNSQSDAQNISLSASVSANALTITLKSASGSNLSATNAAGIAFRSATSATGTAVVRSVTANISITVPSGATLGQKSGANEYVYVWLIDDAGTVDIGVSGKVVLDEATTQNASAINSSSTSGILIYSSTSHTGAKAVRLIGRIAVNEATAGTWASAPTEISLISFAAMIATPVCMRASGVATGSIGSDAVFPTVDFDNWAAYNNTTGQFTAPISGKYMVNAAVLINGSFNSAGDYMQINIYKNGSLEKRYRWVSSAALANNLAHATINVPVICASTDTLSIRIDGSESSQSYGGDGTFYWFSVTRISN